MKREIKKLFLLSTVMATLCATAFGAMTPADAHDGRWYHRHHRYECGNQYPAFGYGAPVNPYPYRYGYAQPVMHRAWRR